jgi:hypothetical protein
VRLKDYQRIVEAVNTILGKYNYPLTLRQVYYRLVAGQVIVNTKNAYKRLSEILVNAREKNDVDDTRMEDRARQVIEANKGYSSPAEFIKLMTAYFRSLGSTYRADLWSDQDNYVELWVEKDALSRAFEEFARPNRITLCPSRGYSSYTYIKREAVDDRFASVDPRKQIVILHFSDHDPSGLNMTDDLQARFKRYARGRSIEVRRVALTIKQVKDYKLIPNPTKVADPRSRSYVAKFGNRCWELDALDPDLLRATIRGAIIGCIDMDKWENIKAREKRDRRKLEERFRKARILL